MRRFLPLALVLLLASCAPVARIIADTLEHSDGATLTYVSGGVTFDPDGRVARTVVISLDGYDLDILAIPQGRCDQAESTETVKFDCFLGSVTQPIFINYSGKSVLAFGSWRRPGSSELFRVFATLEEP